MGARSVVWLPDMRQQFVDAAVLVRWQPGGDVLEVCPRVMPTELCRLHQAHHHGCALPGEFTAREQPSCRFPFNLSVLIFHGVTALVNSLPVSHGCHRKHSLT